jgi:protein O-mannosyl-transferase
MIAAADLPRCSQWPFRSARANAILIFALVLVAYAPALRSGFIWDDHPGHVTRPDLQSVSGLGRIWFEIGATQQYYPLLHTAFWLEHRLWGETASAYHLLNVLLHATAACLVGVLLRRLRVAGAAIAALWFAVHPVTVDSVAWISEQKNTLSTVLYLCAALAYVRCAGLDSEVQSSSTGRPAPRGGAYWLSLGLFVMALATKTVTATLPAALLVILWWRRGRVTWRDIAPLVPWFVLSVAAAIVTSSVERSLIGAQGADFGLGPVERVLLAGRAFWFYLAKLIWPADLAFIYPRWTIAAGAAWQFIFPIAAVALLAVLAWRARRVRGPVAALALFGGSLFPALGFVNVFPFIYSFVADHFQYLASIAALALGAAGLARLGGRATHAIALSLVALFAALTWQQSTTYRDAITLYTTTLARNPACWMAHNNLAIALVDAGRGAEALPHYEEALRLRPRYAEAENNFGYALTALGRAAEGIPHLERALALQPNYAEAQNNLGVAYMALNRPVDGAQAFEKALQLKPNYPVAHVNLGLAFAASGNTADAVVHFARAAELDPRYPDAELNWGIALSMSGHPQEALPHLNRALELRENFAPAHFYLGLALRDLGRNDEAEREISKAQELGFNPNG